MVVRPFKKAALFILLSVPMTALNVIGDKVVLKDGTVEESTRVWETERYVHFILKGTRSVEIRYVKEIVDHIEGADGVVRSLTAKEADSTQASKPQSPTSTPTAGSEKSSISAATPSPLETAPLAGEGSSIHLDRSFIERNRNLTFYDPRRPQRYWADRQSQHANYAAAMAVLSAQYKHSVDWIEKHMGQENDLGAIHASLIAAAEAQAITNPDPLKTGQLPPPQPGKDFVAPNGADDTNKRAAQEPAPEAQPSPPKVIEGAHSPVQAIPPGILFYDPRRPEKYWVSPQAHCASLQAAIQLLAKIYGVPTSHIESNLGESNDLSLIHANIQKSLGMAQK